MTTGRVALILEYRPSQDGGFPRARLALLTIPGLKKSTLIPSLPILNERNRSSSLGMRRCGLQPVKVEFTDKKGVCSPRKAGNIVGLPRCKKSMARYI